MLSYRHGFHAGNPADVFKHAVQIALVRAMQEKPAGITIIDTHSGPARYDLSSEWALKTREFEPGIARLWNDSVELEALQDYLDQVRVHNPDGRLRIYPGSPLISAGLLRPVDRLVLCELHPAEQQALSACFAGQAQVQIEAGDGYQAMQRHLPPATSRGLVMIDPSYELRDELDTMGKALRQALRRFAHGVYLIWYPQIEGRDLPIDSLRESLDLGPEAWLDLYVEFPPEQRLGRMHGCGMVVINPPYRARERLIELTRKGFGGTVHHV